MATRTTTDGPITFTGTAGTTLESYGGFTAQYVSGAGILVLTSDNKLRAGFAGGQAEVHRKSSHSRTGNKRFASAILSHFTGVSGNVQGGVAEACSTSGGDFYAVWASDVSSGSNTFLYKRSGGTLTTPVDYGRLAWADGDEIGIEVDHDTGAIKITRNSAYVGSTYTDGSVLAAGSYGVLGKTNGGGNYLAIDDLIAGTWSTPTGPTIDTQPTTQSVSEGATATFTVAATTSGGSLTYQWQRAEPGSGTFTSVSGATSASYTTAVTGCVADHGAQYKCLVGDTNGSTPTSAVGLVVRSVTTASRPAADVTAAGWTASAGSDLFAVIDETSASDADYITSPAITGTAAWVVMDLQYPLATGTRTVPVRAAVDTGTATLKTRLQDDAGTIVGTAIDTAVTTTPTTYNLSFTLSGPATRIAFAYTT